MIDLTNYEYIVRKYTQSLYRYCYCKFKCNKNLTDETVNDVMRILFEKWDTLNFGKNIKAWLYRVADNCIKHNLSQYNRYYSHINSLEENIENKKFDNFEYYDEYFTNDLMEEEYINRIIDSLPDDFKEIFKLRYLEKKTIAETASILGMPYSTMYLRLTKVEAAVRKEISKIFEQIY